MDLLILTPGIDPDGAREERYALEVAARLARSGRVRVIAPETDRPDPDLPFEVVRAGSGVAGHLARAAVVVRRCASGDGFRIALATSWQGALAALGGRPREAGLRVHAVVYGPELHASPVPGTASATFDRLRSWILGHVDAFHPVSRTVARELAALGVSESRIHVVPVGTDPSRFAPVDGFPARRRLGVGSRPLVLTSAGPGAATVLASMPDVLTEHPRAVLAVRGESAPDLVALADRLGIRDAVRFTGAVPDDQVAALYSAAGVFVLVPGARSDPDAVPILEAAACGVPVVGSRVGDIPDAVRDGVTGLLTPPGKPDAVSAAILFFLNDPGAAQDFGLAARHHVIQQASWDRVVERLLKAMRG